MSGIRIQPGMPEHRHGELWHGDGKGEGMHANAQACGVSFWNARD
jgi:hypothetical protein